MLFHEPLYVTFQIIKITNKQQVKRISTLTFHLHFPDLLVSFLFSLVCRVFAEIIIYSVFRYSHRNYNSSLNNSISFRQNSRQFIRIVVTDYTFDSSICNYSNKQSVQKATILTSHDSDSFASRRRFDTEQLC